MNERPSLLDSLIRFCLEQKLIVALTLMFIIGWGVLVVVLTVGVFWVSDDSAGRRSARAARQADREAIVRLLGTADLFLSSSSRWIRHLSLVEPGAAFQESPAGLDVDPAGGVIGPAPELLAGGARNTMHVVRPMP